jgi:hypothetical protein
MKKNLLILGIAGAALISATTVKMACTDLEQLVTGTVYTMTSYDAKSKVQGTTTTTVKKVETGPTSVTADLDMVMKDGKGKDAGTSTMTMKCENGKVLIDMKSFVTPQMQASNKDMQITYEGDMLEYPTEMTVGGTLPNAKMIMHAASDGKEVMTTTINITDRKIEAKESRTTTAGTWECYKITYTMDVNMLVGSMNMPGMKPMQAVEWFSPKVGAVRSETWKNGKLEGYTELTDLKKPAH